MLRETWMQCPYMFTTFCVAGCEEKLPCADTERTSCGATPEGQEACTEPVCPCWSLYPPPMRRVVRFLNWYIGKLNLGRTLDDETAFALGRSVGWLSLAKNGPKILTDEEVVVYARGLPETFTAGLSHSNPNFFEEGGSFLGSARRYSPFRK